MAPSSLPDLDTTVASPSHPLPFRQMWQDRTEAEASLFSDHSAFARLPKLHSFPDPSQFPDPYPFRPPVLSTGGSSTPSTRSSAYTSSSSALTSSDYGNDIYVVAGDDDALASVGIASEDFLQRAAESTSSFSSRTVDSRMPVDKTRWIDSHTGSRRSHPHSPDNAFSSVGNDSGPLPLQRNSSFDLGWRDEERYQVGLVTDEESDEDHIPGVHDAHTTGVVDAEERTTAIVVAEEGRGLIARGEGISLSQLEVRPGTTHLLLGSSPAPNAIPSFLAEVIPGISHSLLALDISANFLHALSPCLAACIFLEELNVGSNPLRVLPVFLSQLTALRVLIADATGITTLPDALCSLDKLHTLNIRRNRMHSLPSWLSLLPSLQTLLVDNNPFQGPWKALIDPLLAEDPMTPFYPPNTPSFTIMEGSPTSTRIMDGHAGFAESPISRDAQRNGEPWPESRTDILPSIRHVVSPPSTVPLSAPPSHQPPSLVRTRTTPGRVVHTHQDKNGSVIPRSATYNRLTSYQSDERPRTSDGSEIRRLKSAGDLKAASKSSIVPPSSERPFSGFDDGDLSQLPDRPPQAKRFGTLGLTPPPSSSKQNYPVGVSPSAHNAAGAVSDATRSFADDNGGKILTPLDGKGTVARGQTPDIKERGGRWGFLRKMSMGRMRSDSQAESRRVSPPKVPRVPKPNSNSSASPPALTLDGPSTSHELDIRFSSAGFPNIQPDPEPIISPPPLPETQIQGDLLKSSPAPPNSANLLSVSQPTRRPGKRRSFLPIDSGLIAPLGSIAPASDTEQPANGDIAHDQNFAQRSHDNKTEPQGYTRALRSVMAYLRDMNDLALSPVVPQHGLLSEEQLLFGHTPRFSAPDWEHTHAPSGTPMSPNIPAPQGAPGYLRTSDPSANSRNPQNTYSVAMSSSQDSCGEERKYKDDKGRRAMVVREIVETERTYVKGLQELVDIYIKPAAAPVHSITSGATKETVVPAAERKHVFGSIESLFSFHKESFLPALEAAAAPILTSAAALQVADADGQLSISVAKGVGNMFAKHAAFMKMYSSYINNFDNSVQRVKTWSSGSSSTRPATPSTGLTPSSSTTQLASFGLSLSALAGSVSDVNGAALLTSAQRKRIRTYLKRCRLNPRHSQLNLEGYLLLPVQRIPRYKLLLEELLRSTPQPNDYTEDTLAMAFEEISQLANNMNEGKRESESRRKLVQWQSRIRGRFPSPLVQPHRRLIMDGHLFLTRVVRKATIPFEVINAQGNASVAQVECLAPELTPRSLLGILCNDLLVLCRDPSEGQDPSSPVDLWAVLRMQTLPQPASIVHGNALRIVDNKAILYFDAPSPSDALNWLRAINLHIPASKS